MNRSLMLAIPFALVATAALANPGEPGYLGPPAPTTHTLNVSSLAAAKAQARASAQSRSSSAATGGAASAAGGSVSNTINNGGSNGNRGGYSAPPALALAGGGTCAGVSTSGSIGPVPWFSIGGARAELDPECEQRFNIATEAEYGGPDGVAIAIEMTNDLKGVKEARKRLGR